MQPISPPLPFNTSHPEHPSLAASVSSSAASASASVSDDDSGNVTSAVAVTTWRVVAKATDLRLNDAYVRDYTLIAR